MTPWSRSQTLKNKSSSSESTVIPTKRISLRSSFHLKSKKKSRKSTGDIVNADNQEMQNMVPQKQVVEKTNLDNKIEEEQEEEEKEELSENKQHTKEKRSTCKPCCVIS